jgi:hypothetical protein
LAGLLTVLSGDPLADEGANAMAKDVLIEWTTGDPEVEGRADVTVLDDGRVRLSPRLGGGEHRLSPEDLQALRHFVLDQQQFQKIEADALRQEVAAAADQRRRDVDSPGAAFVTVPQMDAGTTVIRANVAGSPHEVAYFDLAGDAQSYPRVERLQRLRRIELRMIELAETLSAEAP